MSTMSIRLPDSLHKRARILAQEDHVSVNQLVATALAEKIAALDAQKLIQDRAARGSRRDFLKALDAVPDVAPDENDHPA